MATYGYLVGSDIDSEKLIPLNVLEQISLTPSKSKFIVVGTKDSIFNWMEHYGELVCEFRTMPHPRSFNRLHRSTTNAFKVVSMDTDPTKIMFNLYDEKDHKCNNIFKRLFSSCTRTMRLEIHALNPNGPSPSPTSTLTPVMKAEGHNGVKLCQVLDLWKSRISNLEQRARDFE